MTLLRVKVNTKTKQINFENLLTNKKVEFIWKEMTECPYFGVNVADTDWKFAIVGVTGIFRILNFEFFGTVSKM